MEKGCFSIGDLVSFQIKPNKDGKPQAWNCSIMENGFNRKKPKVSAAPQPQAPQGGAYYVNGVIKSYSEQNGYGFISCDEIFNELGCDVFLHGSAYEETIAVVGDAVSFRVELNKD